MRNPGTPDYEPPPPDQTLQAWLADSARDWAVSQPTLWLPAVPAEPAPPPGQPSIPEQRGTRRHRAQSTPRPATRTDPDSGGRADPGADPRPDTGAAASAVRSRSSGLRTALMAALLLLAVLVVGLALNSGAWPR